MRLKNFILISSLLLAFFSCCKEEITYEGNTLIGSWTIHQIDSCAIGAPFRDPWFIYDTLSDQGFIEFYADSSGIISPLRNSITNGEQSFYWKHDSVNGFIDFTFPNGSTSAFLSNYSGDSLVFYLRHYLQIENLQVRYYRFSLNKETL